MYIKESRLDKSQCFKGPDHFITQFQNIWYSNVFGISMFGFQAPTVCVKFERTILDSGFFMLTQKNVLLLIFVKTKKTEKVVESSRIINAIVP